MEEPYYVSPEVIQGSVESFKSDIWSLGCTLYEVRGLVVRAAESVMIAPQSLHFTHTLVIPRHVAALVKSFELLPSHTSASQCLECAPPCIYLR